MWMKNTPICSHSLGVDVPSYVSSTPYLLVKPHQPLDFESLAFEINHSETKHLVFYAEAAAGEWHRRTGASEAGYAAPEDQSQATC